MAAELGPYTIPQGPTMPDGPEYRPLDESGVNFAS